MSIELHRGARGALLGLVGGVMLSAAAFAQTDKPPSSAPAPAAEASTEAAADAPVPAGEGPSLWLVSDADSRVWLFGTVHILAPDIAWRRPAIDEAFAEADILYVETDTSLEAQGRLQGVILRDGMNPPGVALSSLLTSEDRARLAALAQRLGVPMAGLEPLRPWLAGVFLGVQLIVAEGGDPESGVERVLEGEARARGMEIRILETPEQQIGFLSGLSPEAELAMLVSSLAQIETRPSLSQDLVAAWLAGDDAGLDALLTDGFADAPEAEEAIMTGRNRAWAEILGGVLAGSGDVFVAVGAGHLVGDEGVPALLAAEGHLVERR